MHDILPEVSSMPLVSGQTNFMIDIVYIVQVAYRNEKLSCVLQFELSLLLVPFTLKLQSGSGPIHSHCH